MKKLLALSFVLLAISMTHLESSHAARTIQSELESAQETIRTELLPDFSINGLSAFAGKTISMYIVSAIKSPMGGTPVIKELLAAPVNLEIPKDGTVTFSRMNIRSKEDAPYNTVVFLIHNNSRENVYPINVNGVRIIDHSSNLNFDSYFLPTKNSASVLLSRYLYRTQILKESQNSDPGFTFGNGL